MSSNGAARSLVFGGPWSVRWRLAVGIGCAGAMVAVGALGLGATCRPAWYRPASVDLGRLRDDRATLVGLQDEISAGLNAGREVRVRVTEDQLNRWLAGWSEIWPDQTVDLGPLRHPHVTLLDGEVRVAATLTGDKGGAVVTLAALIEVSDEQLTVRCTGVRLGVLPFPRAWVISWVARLHGGDRAGAVRSDDGTMAWPNEWVWPNGRRRYRIAHLQVTSGAAELVFQPVGGPARGP